MVWGTCKSHPLIVNTGILGPMSGGGGLCPGVGGGLCQGDLPRQTPPPTPYGEELPVRILLECFLVTVRNIVVAKECFYTCLSFCSQGGVSGRHPRAHLHRQTPPGRHPTSQETATAEDGTHSTGMHSCVNILSSLKS